LVKRIIENGASHVGAAGSPRAAKGKATTAMTAAAAIGLFAQRANPRCGKTVS